MLKGLVLCGGQSSRMGHDKGLKTLGAGSWAQHACQLLHTITPTVVLSINSTQEMEYGCMQQLPVSAPEASCSLLMDDELLPVYGPLKGILSAHHAWPQADWLVLACDMLLMQADVLQHLCGQAALHATEEAFVYGNQQQIQPLCGIYTAGGLARLMGLLQNGALKKSSMHQALAMLRVKYIVIPEMQQHCFTNCNTPGDVAAIAAMESIQS